MFSWLRRRAYWFVDKQMLGHAPFEPVSNKSSVAPSPGINAFISLRYKFDLIPGLGKQLHKLYFIGRKTSDVHQNDLFCFRPFRLANESDFVNKGGGHPLHGRRP